MTVKDRKKKQQKDEDLSQGDPSSSAAANAAASSSPSSSPSSLSSSASTSSAGQRKNDANRVSHRGKQKPSLFSFSAWNKASFLFLLAFGLVILVPVLLPLDGGLVTLGSRLRAVVELALGPSSDSVTSASSPSSSGILDAAPVLSLEADQERAPPVPERDGGLVRELREQEVRIKGLIDSFSYVMDLGVEEDRQRLEQVPDEFKKAVQRYITLRRQLGDGNNRNKDLNLVHETIRGIYRGLSHITKDVLASGKAVELTVDELLLTSDPGRPQHQRLPPAGDWIFMLFDHLISLLSHDQTLVDLLGIDRVDPVGGMTPFQLGTYFRLGRVVETLLSLEVPQPSTTGTSKGFRVDPNRYSRKEALKARGAGTEAQGGGEASFLFEKRRLEMKRKLEAMILKEGGPPSPLRSFPAGAELGWMTALHIAASQNYLQGVKILVEHGGDATLRDHFGRTPIDIARSQGFVELLDYFRSIGASTPDGDSGHGDGVVDHPTTSPVQGTTSSDTDSGWRKGSGTLFDREEEKNGGRCSALRVDLDEVWRLLEAREDGEWLMDELTELLDREVFSIGRPLVVVNGMKGWKVREDWRRENLERELGGRKVMVASIPYGQVFGKTDHGRMKVADYVRQLDVEANIDADAGGRRRSESREPMYVFDSEILREGTGRGGVFFETEKNQLPRLFFEELGYGLGAAKARHLQFFLGPEGSGAPFHYHCPAVNALVYGRKRWLLYPPGQSFYSKRHPYEDFLEYYRQQGDKEGAVGGGYNGRDLRNFREHRDLPFECEQGEGEIMFVPVMWTHAVLNLSENIGFATEFDLGDC